MKQQTIKLCEYFRKNINFLENGLDSMGSFKHRVVLIRYEDFAYNPSMWAERLYRFLGREIPKEVQEFIAKNTNGSGKETIWNTSRNSSTTAESWREKISMSQLNFIQNECSTVLDALGYKLVEDKTHLLDRRRSVLGSIHAKVPQLK